MNWTPSERYRQVAAANRAHYAAHALRYEETETCVVSPQKQEMLERDLEAIVTMLRAKGNRRLVALDACGGSGNVAVKLLARGVDVVLCDISAELIELFESKCRNLGLSSYDTACEDVATFLAESQQQFDLVVFSSALHHLEDYSAVLQLVIPCLKHGGYLYTVFDPANRTFPARLLLWADYICFKIVHHPADLVPALGRKWRRLINRRPASQGDWECDPEMLVEYHTQKGIDDHALVEALTEEGLVLVWHERYADARYMVLRLILRLFGCKTTFKALLTRKRPERSVGERHPVEVEATGRAR